VVSYVFAYSTQVAASQRSENRVGATALYGSPHIEAAEVPCRRKRVYRCGRAFGVNAPQIDGVQACRCTTQLGVPAAGSPLMPMRNICSRWMRHGG
jgi:hypothetical protein